MSKLAIFAEPPKHDPLEMRLPIVVGYFGNIGGHNSRMGHTTLEDEFIVNKGKPVKVTETRDAYDKEAWKAILAEDEKNIQQKGKPNGPGPRR